MIEINLVPDVKQELIHAQRVRTTVISISIIAAIIFAGLVVLLSLYVFGAQAIRGALLDNSISSESKKLSNVKDLGKALTIQQQMSQISSIHSNTTVDSRLFDILTTTIPSDTTVSTFRLDSDTNTLTINGETSGSNAYNNLDVLKKTLLATKFEYENKDDRGKKLTVPLTKQISDGDRSYTQDSEGNRVLRFSISFEYAEELFSRNSVNGTIVAPTHTNATDSKLDVPSSLFTPSGSTGSGEN